MVGHMVKAWRREGQGPSERNKYDAYFGNKYLAQEHLLVKVAIVFGAYHRADIVGHAAPGQAGPAVCYSSATMLG